MYQEEFVILWETSLSLNYINMYEHTYIQSLMFIEIITQKVLEKRELLYI